jgi:predicted transcriptional regulator YdeE
MQPKITERARFHVMGALQRTSPSSNTLSEHWNRWGATLGQMRSEQQGYFYGVMNNFGGEPFAFDYVAGVSVAHDVSVLEEFVLWEIPTQTYAVFDTTLSTLMETLQKIHNEWLSTSGYKRGNGIEFEQYAPDFTKPHKPLTLWIPVEKVS